MATILLLALAAVAAAGKPRPSTDAERAGAVARVRRLMLGAGWRHPFFLPAVARVTIVADDTIPTACAERQGRIRFNPIYLGSGQPGNGLTDPQATFVVCHELLHLILCHWARRNGRPFKKWNRATDRAINQALRDSGISPPPDVLFPEAGKERNTAEEHYAGEPDQDGDNDQGQGQGQGPNPGQGCGPVDGPPGDEDGQGQSGGSDDWRETERQCRALDRTASQGKGSAFSRLTDIPPAKVNWKQVVRRALHQAIAEAGTDDVSWSRRSRRSASLPGIPVLPGGVSHRARIALCFDTSGSVADVEIKRAVAEGIALVHQAGLPVYVVVHDAGVQFSGWIKPGESAPSLAAKMTGRGGTLFHPAYNAIDVVKGPRFGVVIHFTDGEPCETWPPKPARARHAVAAIVGRPASMVKAPDTFRVVEVEV